MTTFEIPSVGFSLPELFSRLERSRSSLGILEYSVSQTTLDQVSTPTLDKLNFPTLVQVSKRAVSRPGLKSSHDQCPVLLDQAPWNQQCVDTFVLWLQVFLNFANRQTDGIDAADTDLQTSSLEDTEVCGV